MIEVSLLIYGVNDSNALYLVDILIFSDTIKFLVVIEVAIGITFYLKVVIY